MTFFVDEAERRSVVNGLREMVGYCEVHEIEARRDGLDQRNGHADGFRVCADRFRRIADRLDHDGIEAHDASTPAPSLERTIKRMELRLARLEGDQKTGPLARAEGARDQAEEQLANAQRAIKDNHATMEQLRAELAEARENPKAPRKDSMLAAAKLSLKEAERLEAQADREDYNSDDPDVRPNWRERTRDEFLLANAQASIAVAEALEAGTDTERLTVDQETESAGHNVGTAYVEVRPDFSAFGEAISEFAREIAKLGSEIRRHSART